MTNIRQYFSIDQHPRRGLLAAEWVMVGYVVLTLLVMFFCYTKLRNPEAMLWGRMRILAVTAALWAVYRMVPCRMTLAARVVVQMALLSWWYPDTYEINRMFPNLDHLFAQWEQQLFGCQPALLFWQALPHLVVSELMNLGYAAYYPMIAAVALYYLCCRYEEFLRASTVIVASFFVYYVVFIFLPVVGPTFYYEAVGIDEIARGSFPNLHDYFNYHQACLPTPGYADGFFYHLVEGAKAAGERPTAAFPSSHVGVSVVLMMLAWHSRSRWLFFVLLPLFVLLCMATVYIQAHYAIDALAGLASGAALYWLLMALTSPAAKPKLPKQRRQ